MKRGTLARPEGDGRQAARAMSRLTRDGCQARGKAPLGYGAWAARLQGNGNAYGTGCQEPPAGCIE